MNHSLGILGGMGPLASAEFLKTIYQFQIQSTEQQSPVCFLYSDPSIPDRTQAILDGSDDAMLGHLTTALESLHRLHVNKIVITCVTSHHLLPRLSPGLSENIISLVEVTLRDVLRRRRRCLLACSEGTRTKRVFEQNSQWAEAKQYVILPDEQDQAKIHSLIYLLKANGSPEQAMQSLAEILNKYESNCFVAGCTEFHLLAKYLMSSESRIRGYDFVDPLVILASEFKSFVND